MAQALSPIRRYEHAWLTKHCARGTGRVLDFGGAHNAEYKPLLKFKKYQSVNINPELQPDHVWDLNQAFYATNHADTVLCMNTLEHVQHYEVVLNSAWRALKPNGRFLATVPFLHQVHGSPNDYTRLTANAWYGVLARAGFTNIKIETFSTGPCMTTCSLWYGMLPGFLRNTTVWIARRLDLAFRAISPRYGDLCKNYPLGYGIHATKA